MVKASAARRRKQSAIAPWGDQEVEFERFPWRQEEQRAKSFKASTKEKKGNKIPPGAITRSPTPSPDHSPMTKSKKSKRGELCSHRQQRIISPQASANALVSRG